VLLLPLPTLQYVPMYRRTCYSRRRFASNRLAQEVFKEQMLELMRDGRLSKAEMTLYANSHSTHAGRGLREQAQQREEQYAREKDSGSSGADMRVGNGGGGGSSSSSGGGGGGGGGKPTSRAPRRRFLSSPPSPRSLRPP